MVKFYLPSVGFKYVFACVCKCPSCRLSLLSLFDELNCCEFSKIWPTPNYWSQKINICLTLQTCQLVRLLLQQPAWNLAAFQDVCLQYGSAAALDMTAEARAHLSVTCVWVEPEQSICFSSWLYLFFMILLSTTYLCFGQKAGIS